MASQTIRVSNQPITITTPKSLVFTNVGNSSFIYQVVIKTSDIDDAGTDSKIYVKIGNGPYTHLDLDGHNDFEKGCEDSYAVTVDSSLLYNNCGGTIPVTLRYEKSGTAPGWHCAWIQLNILRYEGSIFTLKTVITGNKYTINHWFGAEDHNQSIIEETYYLTNYERNIVFGGTFTGETETLNLQSNSGDYAWERTSPSVTDTGRGVSYNPYEYINAPVLSVSFDNNRYNRYITQGVKSFTIKSKELYAAMLADGVKSLELTYTLQFDPMNGDYSVTSGTRTRTKTMKVVCGGLQTSAFTEAVPLKLMSSSFAKSFANITSTVESGRNGTFDVSYRLDGASSVWGTRFAVNYDKTKVELVGYTLGNVYTDKEFVPPQSYANGRFVFLAARNDLTDTPASGKLITLHFRVKDGVKLTDYPVAIDTDVSQSIDSEGRLLTTPVSMNAPVINAIGNTETILSQDTVTLFASAGTASVQSVSVQKDDGEFVDITGTYENGYTVTENGAYTFRLVTTDGDTATAVLTYTLIDPVKPVVAVDAGGYTADTWQKGLRTTQQAIWAQPLTTTASARTVRG